MNSTAVTHDTAPTPAGSTAPELIDDRPLPPAPTVDVPTRRRTPLNLMSPLRIGFTATIGALVAYGLAQALIQARSVLILLVVAMFIALGLNVVVEFLMRRGLRRNLAVVATFVIVIAVLGLAAFAVVPVFSAQISSLVANAPEILQNTLRNPQVNSLNQRYQVVTKAQKFLASGGLVASLFGGLLGAGKVVLSALFSGFTVLILTLYFLVSLPAIKNAIYRLSPATERTRVRGLEDQIFKQIGAYLSGTFLVALIAGVFSYIFLLIIGLGQYALALAVVVALLDIIPMIGASLAAVVVVVVAFVHSPGAGVAALIFYLIYQQFENYVVQPRVFKKAVDIPGAIVVIAALIGGTLLGIVGAMLAVPVAAAILLILREVIQPRLDAR